MKNNYHLECVRDGPVKPPGTDTAELEVRGKGFGRVEYVRVPPIGQVRPGQEGSGLNLDPLFQVLQGLPLSALK